MKIALVYSGQPRDIKECFPNHWETFWKTNEGCEVDVFAHMWNDEGGYFWDDHKVRGKVGVMAGSFHARELET